MNWQNRHEATESRPHVMVGGRSPKIVFSHLACESILSRSRAQAELVILEKATGRKRNGRVTSGNCWFAGRREPDAGKRSRRASSGTTIARPPFLRPRIGGGGDWAQVGKDATSPTALVRRLLIEGLFLLLGFWGVLMPLALAFVGAECGKEINFLPRYFRAGDACDLRDRTGLFRRSANSLRPPATGAR